MWLPNSQKPGAKMLSRKSYFPPMVSKFAQHIVLVLWQPLTACKNKTSAAGVFLLMRSCQHVSCRITPRVDRSMAYRYIILWIAQIPVQQRLPKNVNNPLYLANCGSHAKNRRRRCIPLVDTVTWIRLVPIDSVYSSF